MPATSGRTQNGARSSRSMIATAGRRSSSGASGCGRSSGLRSQVTIEIARRRARSTEPVAPTPAISIAQAAGSGAAENRGAVDADIIDPGVSVPDHVRSRERKGAGRGGGCERGGGHTR